MDRIKNNSMAMRQPLLMLAILAVFLQWRECSAHSTHNHDHNHHHTDQQRSLESTTEGHRTCGFQTPSAETIEATQQDIAGWKQKHPSFDAAAVGPYVIPTIWHDVRRDDGSRGVSQAEIETSMQVLNDAFAVNNSPFQFELQGITRTFNTNYWNGNGDSQLIADFRRGGCETLNIFSHSGAGSLGYVYLFPRECEIQGTSLDGVFIHYGSVPGSDVFEDRYDEGDTLVHEVGHWLGLFHTFDGPCGSNGDRVDDTPESDTPDFECDENFDSCPTFPGKDLIDNYMNYGYDSCLELFTPGQVERMVAQYELYRFEGPAPTDPPAISPSNDPSSSPSAIPSLSPSEEPTMNPTPQPTPTPISTDPLNPVVLNFDEEALGASASAGEVLFYHFTLKTFSAIVDEVMATCYTKGESGDVSMGMRINSQLAAFSCISDTVGTSNEECIVTQEGITDVFVQVQADANDFDDLTVGCTLVILPKPTPMPTLPYIRPPGSE